ncbi:MAG TPA: zinc dependent phospholipase C family protein [Chryseosolibacter sp.]|nr:zinc dependent phospholipase C family protein [Chryseosolibacter sp.]
MKRTLLLAMLSMLTLAAAPMWGFFAHQRINRLAVFTLPPDLIGFYKKHIATITEASVNPDRRRYAVPEEGARHFMDVDHYGDSVVEGMPRNWFDASEAFEEDTLKDHGILPWHIYAMYLRLRDAFMVRDPGLIIKISAELGHYVADAHVPLHTTKNYNGQLTGQEGIHGFWESRLPEVFSNEYDFMVGRAEYLNDPRQAAWDIVMSSHALVDAVLNKEKELERQYAEKKYSFEQRGNTTVKVYAMEYTAAYHRALDGMVEAQMRASIKMIGSYWLTAWIDAGQPDMRKLIHYSPSEEELARNRAELEEWKAGRCSGGRGHE